MIIKQKEREGKKGRKKLAKISQHPTRQTLSREGHVTRTPPVTLVSSLLSLLVSLFCPLFVFSYLVIASFQTVSLSSPLQVICTATSVPLQYLLFRCHFNTSYHKGKGHGLDVHTCIRRAAWLAKTDFYKYLKFTSMNVPMANVWYIYCDNNGDPTIQRGVVVITAIDVVFPSEAEHIWGEKWHRYRGPRHSWTLVYRLALCQSRSYQHWHKRKLATQTPMRSHCAWMVRPTWSH